MVSFKIVAAVILVFASCTINVVLLEYLIKFSPGCGDLVTFFQFLFIASYGFVKVSKYGTQPPKVPIREYLLAVVLFLGSSLAGNLALGCHISMPIQMLFKSGSVLASLMLGVIYLKRQYSLTKYVSVVMITVGIAMCLIINTSDKHESKKDGDLLTWTFGVFLLATSLFMGARLGVAQEEISQKYGRYPEELMFYTHALALPGFIFFAPRISKQFGMFSKSEPVKLPYLGLDVPVVWIYLVGNVISQFGCSRSVYVLATEMSSLAVTVILTVRKFTSLLISIFYFNNPFTVYHWCGTFLVFTGTLLFSETLQKLFKKLKKD